MRNLLINLMGEFSGCKSILARVTSPRGSFASYRDSDKQTIGLVPYRFFSLFLINSGVNPTVEHHCGPDLGGNGGPVAVGSGGEHGGVS